MNYRTLSAAVTVQADARLRVGPTDFVSRETLFGISIRYHEGAARLVEEALANAVDHCILIGGCVNVELRGNCVSVANTSLVPIHGKVDDEEQIIPYEILKSPGTSSNYTRSNVCGRYGLGLKTIDALTESVRLEVSDGTQCYIYTNDSGPFDDSGAGAESVASVPRTDGNAENANPDAQRSGAGNPSSTSRTGTASTTSRASGPAPRVNNPRPASAPALCQSRPASRRSSTESPESSHGENRGWIVDASMIDPYVGTRFFRLSFRVSGKPFGVCQREITAGLAGFAESRLQEIAFYLAEMRFDANLVFNGVPVVSEPPVFARVSCLTKEFGFSYVDAKECRFLGRAKAYLYRAVGFRPPEGAIVNGARVRRLALSREVLNNVFRTRQDVQRDLCVFLVIDCNGIEFESPEKRKVIGHFEVIGRLFASWELNSLCATRLATPVAIQCVPAYQYAAGQDLMSAVYANSQLTAYRPVYYQAATYATASPGRYFVARSRPRQQNLPRRWVPYS
ncbi:GyrB-like ATPase domain protein [Nile crocodilepox virus]|uniref:GyrB-like ATPase domain protein n=1 Tax=Nile crocodilepox virus (isolate Crocodylus niloticus/Zimbabwe/Ume/2001) TaxID=1289473 RepID=Q070G2_CPRVZ|nr:GyrB-like ATPase domain protein [Nile crocodilepox virus]ABJ08980.1 GyrB-like ATPase domain protein [Nile crocodilepox virus]